MNDSLLKHVFNATVAASPVISFANNSNLGIFTCFCYDSSLTSNFSISSKIMDYEFEDFDDDAIDEFINSMNPSLNKTNDKLLVKSELKQPGPEHLQVLTKCFGHKNFRPMQWEIISAIINEKRDVCAIMSTGYGKSLCFQYPSTFLGGITLVISPLISLMEDQVLALTVSNIPACLLGTAQTQQRKVIDDIFQNKYNIIYLTPEFCSGDIGNELLTKMSNKLTINLIAIDEAHCISSWGHDFRGDYRNLGILRRFFPQVPIIAVTATATPQVRDDIVKSLKLRNPLVVCSGFDRPNLYFEIHLKKGAIFNDLSRVMVNENGRWKFSGPSIVYCITRKDTENICETLKTNGIPCLPYHAGLSMKARQEAHEQFVKDKIDVIVATIAFGMGIDKPDIRNVVHYGMSKSIENYYQEVGRAGRDGLPAKCVLIYNSADLQTWRIINDKSGRLTTKDTALKKMEAYLDTRNCRRRFILEYFEDKIQSEEEPKNSCCDNCTKKLCDKRTDQEKYEGVDEKGCYDFTDDARKFLKVVSLIGEKRGLNTFILFMRGTKAKSAKLSDNLLKHPLNGSGKDRTEEWWKCIAKILIQEKYLKETLQRLKTGFSYRSLSLTNKGLLMLHNNEKLLLPPPTNMLKLLKAKSSNGLWLTTQPINTQPSTSTKLETNTETQEEIDARMSLYRKLLDIRTEISSQLDCMPYMVASNTVLMQISKVKPKTINDLRALNLDGFPEAKILKFGAAFLNVIWENSGPKTDVKRTIMDILTETPLPDVSTSLTAQVSCTMLQSGLTVGEIAAKRGVTVSTIVSHLVSGIKLGFPVKMIELGVNDEQRDLIIEIYRRFYKTGFTNVRLSEIKENCPPEITYDQIKTVLAYLQVRCHLTSLNIEYQEFEDFKFNELDFKIDALSQNLEDFKPSSSLGEVKIKKEIEPLLTNLEVKTEDEPPAKKEKIDFSILDSPPRQYEPVQPNTQVKTECHNVPNTNNSKKKVLPPWLVKKKVN